jgi:hypothetical protein
VSERVLSERALNRALLARRSVVQGTLLRSTIHLVAARDWWARVNSEKLAARQMSAAARRLRPRLAGATVLRRAEIEAAVGKYAASGVGHWLPMVRVPPSGTWERRRADLCAAAEEWLGPADVTRDDAVDHLVSRYLGGFGPATLADIAGWAGVPAAQVAPAARRIGVRPDDEAPIEGY